MTTPRRPVSRIAIQPRNPAATYLKEMRAAAPEEAAAVYTTSRAQYANSPQFFLDWAAYFLAIHKPELAIRALSNIAAMDVQDPALLRTLGQRLAQAVSLDPAVRAFEDVLRLRPNEPQSYRDLALVLRQRADAAARLFGPASRRGNASDPGQAAQGPDDGDKAARAAVTRDYARSVELLTEVLMRRWGGPPGQIELSALTELNRTLVRAKPYGVQAKGLDPRLASLLPGAR